MITKDLLMSMFLILRKKNTCFMLLKVHFQQLHVQLHELMSQLFWSTFNNHC